LQFADREGLALLAWGSRRSWGKAGSYNEFTRKEIVQNDRLFDDVARGWELGVKQLVQTYNIPSRDYFMWACSGASNWAHRLALRKPQYFAAIHLEILTTFDVPTPGASNIMWLLTTGELESGYRSSKIFFSDCRKLGYPIIYKAYPGIGHSGCSAATNLGRVFFQYAWETINKPTPTVALGKDPRLAALSARKAGFQTPVAYGDLINQIVVDGDKGGSMSSKRQVPLPSRELAEAWEKR
jgi:hypothetical protein